MGIFTCLTSGEQKCGKTKFKAIDYCRNRAYSTNLKIFTRCQINIASAGQAIWERFCKAIEAEEFLSDPRYTNSAARSQHRDALNAAIETYTQRYYSEELIALLNKAGVPCGPIYSIDQ